MGKVTVIKDNWSGELSKYFTFDTNPTWFSDEINSNELLSPIPADFLDGVRVKVGDTELEISNKNSYLELELTSWVGISIGAVHCYGTLKLWNVDVKEVGSNYSKCGYLGAPKEEFPLPFMCTDLKVKIVRPIEQKDLDYRDGDRYHGYRIGEMTRDWWSKKDHLKEGKRIVKEFFPNWKLEINDRT